MVTIYNPLEHQHLLPALVSLHEACISDGALLRYHPPFTTSQRERILAFWQEQHDQVVGNRRIIILSLASESTVKGVITLGMPDADTGPFRGDVEMLMVSPTHRQGGEGKMLMREVEKIAKEMGRTLLQLGTTEGSVAEEYLYPRLGYTKIGRVPNYGVTPDGQLVHGVYFYKDLRESEDS